MHWISQQRRTIPACLPFSPFLSSHCKGGWCIKAPLHPIVTTSGIPALGGLPSEPWQVSVHWVPLQAPSSILHIKDCTPSFSASLAVTEEPDGAFHPLHFLYSLPYYDTLACFPVFCVFQMVFHNSARQIQNCLISKIGWNQTNVTNVYSTHADLKCLHIVLS